MITQSFIILLAVMAIQGEAACQASSPESCEATSSSEQTDSSQHQCRLRRECDPRECDHRVFSGECCHSNKVAYNPYHQEDCTEIQTSMNYPQRFMKHGYMFHHGGSCIPAQHQCESCAPKVQTIIPQQIECIDPLMNKCCYCQNHCPRPYSCQCLPFQMFQNDCWW